MPYIILDHRLGLNPNQKILPTTGFAKEFQRRAQILINKTKKNILQSYLKYKEYYDRKAKAAPLEQGDYCFILQPLADNQGSENPFREFRWMGPYVIENVLPIENYIVRKLNSNKTQIIQSIRLRKYNQIPPQDIRPQGNLQAVRKLSSYKMIYISSRGKRISKNSLHISTYKTTPTIFMLIPITKTK